MSINEKVKSIVSNIIEQVLDAVNEELVLALQEQLASIKTGALPLAVQRRPVAKSAVAAAVKRARKLCKQEGCSNTAVPRYRNFCKDHQSLAKAEKRSIAGKKGARKRKRAAKKA